MVYVKTQIIFALLMSFTLTLIHVGVDYLFEHRALDPSFYLFGMHAVGFLLGLLAGLFAFHCRAIFLHKLAQKLLIRM